MLSHNAPALPGSNASFESLEPRWLLAALLDLQTCSGPGYDFNVDGHPDVVTYDPTTGNLFVELMDADGKATGPADGLGTFYVGQKKGNWQLGGAGNWLGDGRTDLLWHNLDTGAVQVQEMAGKVPTDNAQTIGGLRTSDWEIVGVADFDGNGTDDILWQNDETGSVSLWEMDGTTVDTAVSFSTIDLSVAQVRAAGDLNADGTVDLLVENPTTHAMSAWLLDAVVIGQVDSVQVIDTPPADHTWRVGGITKFRDDTASDVLLRAMDGLTNANFIDWKLDSSLAHTTDTIYTRAPIRQAFMTADAIASLPLTPAEASDSLIPIVPGGGGLQWRVFNINGVPTECVLLQTWTSYNYTGKETSAGADLWCSLDLQTREWYADHEVDWTDVYQRTTQMLGMPADTYKTQFVQVWVAPQMTVDSTHPHASIWRPAPDPDYTTTTSPLAKPATFVDPTYESWFDYQVSQSYLPPSPTNSVGGYPWTRLGYTYDWGDPLNNEGITEYIVPKGTPLIVNDSISNARYWAQAYGDVEYVTAGHSFTYLDADGDRVTVSLKGAGQVEVDLPPDGGDAVAFVAAGTDARSRMSVSVHKANGGDGKTTVSEIEVGTFVDGASLASLQAGDVSLADGGKITINGWIGRLAMDDVLDSTQKTQHRLQIRGTANARPATISFHQVADLTVTSDTPISSFTAASWSDPNSTRDGITTPWIGAVKMTGDRSLGDVGSFSADVTLSSALLGVSLRNLKVAGDIVRSAISVQDHNGDGYLDGWVRSITAAQWDAGSLTARGLSTLKITGGGLGAFDGDCGANLALGGSFVAASRPTLGEARIAGDWTAATWRIGGNVDLLSVAGTASDSLLVAGGDIDRIRLGATDGSDFLAGMDLTSFPAGRRFAESPADFADPTASIRRLDVVGWKVGRGQTPLSFVLDSNVSAPAVGDVRLRNAPDSNAYTFHILEADSNVRHVRYWDTADASLDWSWRPNRTYPAPWDVHSPFDVLHWK